MFLSECHRKLCAASRARVLAGKIEYVTIHRGRKE